MQIYIYILFVFLLSIFGSLDVRAYDFSAINDDGKCIYYNIIGDDCLEVTYCQPFQSTVSYVGTLNVPETVYNDSRLYTVTSLSRRAFYGCSALSEVNLPTSVTFIGDWAFAGCIALEKFCLPKGVKSLGINVFDGCFSLNGLSVDKSNPSFSAVDNILYDKELTTLIAAAPGREGDVVLPPLVAHIAPNAFFGCNLVKNVTLNDQLSHISRNAFYFCNGLENIYIPQNISDIGSAAFADCFSLKEINVDGGNPYFTSYDGTLYDKSMTRAIQSPAARIGDISLADGVKTVGSMAFMRSYALTSIVLPDGVETIEDAAFIDCSNVSTVFIPASVSVIGNMSFGLCDNIATVYVDNPSPEALSVGEGAFASACDKFRTLMVPTGSADAYAKVDEWSCFDIILEYDHLKRQAIEWDCDNDIAASDTLTVSLSATASSGLEVEYVLSPESKGLASIDGNILKVIKGGDIYVTAVQNGNMQFAPAQPVTRLIKTPVVGITDAVTDCDIRVYTSSNNIIVRGAAADDIVEVYDIMGRLHYSGYDNVIPIRFNTIYIVRLRNWSFKVAAPAL